MTLQRVYKYATGDIIPKGSQFLSTIVQEVLEYDSIARYVWHYFLVEVDQ